MPFPENNNLAESMLNTHKYYDDNANKYFDITSNVDMSDIYMHFLKYIPRNGIIMDAGSGSGRDTIAFLKKGFSVYAFDASYKLAMLSTKLTGIKTKVMQFSDIDDIDKYDGIWACASLLHVSEEELPLVISKMALALKNKGVLYFSFKYGSGDRISDEGRYFLDLNDAKAKSIIDNEENLELVELWHSKSVNAKISDEEWINVISRKV